MLSIVLVHADEYYGFSAVIAQSAHHFSGLNCKSAYNGFTATYKAEDKTNK